ncbi:MAG TPA: FHA domain-containing protein [Planctomycetaceae bacterium]|nr:FHA domain-containing protein [Planctomycetaceae bacterium]
MFDLVVMGGKLEGKRLLLPLEKDIVIGRDEDCQIVLQSTQVSRKHCQLRRTELGVQVKDLTSQNGTFVNDVPIESETLLVLGDTLRIGAVVFEVHAHATNEAVWKAQQEKKSPAGNQKSAEISDRDIESWLSENESTAAAPAGTAPKARTEAAIPVTPAAKAAAAPASTAAKLAKPRTVKDEAADIIRRHWADARGEQSDSSADS